MAGKARRIKRPKRGKVIFGRDILDLVDLANAILNGEIISGSTNELLISDLKVLWKVKGGGTTDSGSGDGGAIVGSLFRFKSYHTNYFTCRTWDGTTEGSTDVHIAVPFKLRENAAETIDGTDYIFTYSNDVNGNRVRESSYDSDPDVTEQQIIIPRLLPDDLIVAAAILPGYTSVTSPVLTHFDLNVDSRAWCGITGQTNPFPNL